MVDIARLGALLRNAGGRKHGRCSNVDIFNRWRKLRRGKGYRDLDLNWINVSGANLKGINLEKVHFLDAKLDGANLEGANLRRAAFSYTDANRANFRNADLRDCTYLSKLYADGANFENADLRGAYFDNKHEWIMKGLLGNAYFSRTKITPEQKGQLMSDFGIPEDYFRDRFRIMPRSQYLEGPNAWFFKKGLEAHKKAEREGRIFTMEVDGETLEYAVIPRKGNEYLYDHWACAFSMCRPRSITTALFGSEVGKYMGSWWYFVFDVVPEEFREFAAVHEFTERTGGSHLEAMRMEYGRAKNKGVLPGYTAWVLQNFPDILIGDILLVEGGEEALPKEVVEATKKIFPDDVEAWKKKEENKKLGLPIDIWILAWRGLTNRQISEELTVKGYNVSSRTVRYYRESMEIPGYRAIQRLTYLAPL